MYTYAYRPKSNIFALKYIKLPPVLDGDDSVSSNAGTGTSVSKVLGTMRTGIGVPGVDDGGDAEDVGVTTPHMTWEFPTIASKRKKKQEKNHNLKLQFYLS